MKNQTAFTLVELMTVIAIMGILSAIVYPSYQNSITKSRRADATGVLTSFANAMERRFTETGSYCDAVGVNGTAEANCGTGANDIGSPAIFPTKSPIDGTDTYYNLIIVAVSPTSYVLGAAPANAQAKDKCGALTLTNTGVRGVGGATVAECW